jgi:8-oxo-dGTP diphosphatase
MNLRYLAILLATKLLPMASADCAIVSKEGILLTRRNIYPFKGKWVLPGGMVEPGEALEETGLKCRIVGFAGFYSGPHRDPRWTSVNAVYLMRPVGGKPTTNWEVSEIKWFKPNQLPPKSQMGFDHHRVAMDALRAARKKK